MRIVVTGGAGDLGSRVIGEVTRRGHEAVSASRRTGVDLTTGAGLDAALVGADAVVNCADDLTRGDAVTVAGAHRVAAAAARTGVHLVHISIVGIDDFPLRYYRRKLRAETLIEDAGGSATVLRATQFHSLAAYFARTLTKGPLTFAIGEMAFQPVDTDFVATRLADLALGASPSRGPHEVSERGTSGELRGVGAAYTRARDLAGPEVLPVAELATLVRRHRGASAPRLVRLPALGGTMRAFANRQNVPAPGMAETGGRSFAEWLAEQPPVLSGR